ncbi:MAG TPA: DUF4139 domain-containing protein [Rhodanobacteraceae bacterium]|nr:DUF4139 domain-containing protein [Rhodanobacteraceae bacterium]
MQRSFLCILVAAAVANAAAAENAAVTICRADNDALFDSGSSPVGDGYAIMHEQRALKLAGGREAVVVGGLPATLDAEAVSIDLGAGARVLAQRVLSTSEGGMLAAHRGEQVWIGRGAAGLTGTLLGLDNGALIVKSDTGLVYVREYDTLRFTQQDAGMPGSTLQLTVDGKPGDVDATLTYPTAGLGWRAAYSALLLDGAACRMRLDALASIANRSGRDYDGAMLKLIAGSPNTGRIAPHPAMYKAMAAAPAPAAPEALPEQSAFGDYRSYAIDGALDLPNASVTQVPLYAASELDCERHWTFESGGAWFPPKPITNADYSGTSSGPVLSELRFKTSENLPAGNLRVLTRDRDGRIEFLGQARIADTQKGRPVPVALGSAFDLSARRERTAFNIDKAAREMTEGFRITLSNTGEVERTIRVREHPNRWRGWTLVSSSRKPSEQKPDLLAFEVPVPANGEATLDYVVKYAWTPKDE